MAQNKFQLGDRVKVGDAPLDIAFNTANGFIAKEIESPDFGPMYLVKLDHKWEGSEWAKVIKEHAAAYMEKE